MKGSLSRRSIEVRASRAVGLRSIITGRNRTRHKEQTTPLPLFNRNQEEIAIALANRNVSKVELEGRLLAAKQEVDSSYAKLALAKERINVYGRSYLGDLEKMLALTRKAYESGEMTIFEFSIAHDRFTQARFRSLDAVLTYLEATAELEAQAPGCLK